MKRNMLATLAVSLGVPMLTAGDEMGRTQQGNNNAYCQDTEISWVNWKLDANANRLLAFTRKAFALRREFPILRRCRFWHGDPVCDAGIRDAEWFRPDGSVMTAGDWNDAERRSFGVLLHEHIATGSAARRGRGTGARRRATSADQPHTLYIIANADAQPVPFRLPIVQEVRSWRVRLCTDDSEAEDRDIGDSAVVPQRSMLILQGLP
jgi:glycogen operon protein